MQITNNITILTLFLFLLTGGVIAPTLPAQESDPFGPPVQAVQQQQEVGRVEIDAKPEQEQDDSGQAGESKDAEEEPVVSTADMAPVIELADQQVRIHLWDGSIVGGELQSGSISVKTEFGMLNIPIKRIKRFYPGLDSFPQISSKLDGLVEQLGDKEFENREAAHRELNSMGKLLRFQIQRFDDGGSAERKKHLDNLKSEIEEMVSVEEDFELTDNPAERPLIRGDTIVTPEFTIVGKIQEEMFVLKNKFGTLNVPLADVLMGDRSYNSTPDSVRKSVTIDGHSFFQTKPVATKIRVRKGDRIQIRATGTVNWTNWGNVNSTPDGIPNQGNWKNFASGTLLARVGEDNDKLHKIGSKGEFVAKQNGLLYLGIAVRDNYATNSGYRWVGNYKAKVLVQPGSGN